MGPHAIIKAQDGNERNGSHPEDNDAAIRQQRGLESPHARPGRLSLRETGVHVVDNWILDQVLDAAA